MTPEEAIKEIKAWQVGKGNPSYDKLNRALNLGIEALKLNKSMRETYAHPELLILPGEAEE